MEPENSCMEILDSLMTNTQSELLKVIKENKELKIKLASFEKEYGYWKKRRDDLELVNMGGGL